MGARGMRAGQVNPIAAGWAGFRAEVRAFPHGTTRGARWAPLDGYFLAAGFFLAGAFFFGAGSSSTTNLYE